MTRINVVPVHLLSDKHLLAEYRELPRVFSLARPHLQNKVLPVMPAKYTLGHGHVKFFYNKISWLITRYIALCQELNDRDVQISISLINQVLSSARAMYKDHKELLDSTWKPSPEDYYLNMARLAKRCDFPSTQQELQEVVSNVQAQARTT